MFLRDVATWRRRFQLFPSTFSSDHGRQRRFEGLVKVLQRRLVAPESNVVLGTRIKPALDIDRAATKEHLALERGLTGAGVITHRVTIDAVGHRCRTRIERRQELTCLCDLILKAHHQSPCRTRCANGLNGSMFREDVADCFSCFATLDLYWSAP